MEAGDRGGGIRKAFFCRRRVGFPIKLFCNMLSDSAGMHKARKLGMHAANAAAYRIWSPPDELAPSDAPSFPGRVGAGKAD